MDRLFPAFFPITRHSKGARRSEYWYFTLFNVIVTLVLDLLVTMLGLPSVLLTVYSLVVLVPGLAVSWRRLHDIGKSGAFWFLWLIPIIGWIILIVWYCRDSEPGENRFGPNPKL